MKLLPTFLTPYNTVILAITLLAAPPIAPIVKKNKISQRFPENDPLILSEHSSTVSIYWLPHFCYLNLWSYLSLPLIWLHLLYDLLVLWSYQFILLFLTLPFLALNLMVLHPTLHFNKRLSKYILVYTVKYTNNSIYLREIIPIPCKNLLFFKSFPWWFFQAIFLCSSLTATKPSTLNNIVITFNHTLCNPNTSHFLSSLCIVF